MQYSGALVLGLAASKLVSAYAPRPAVSVISPSLPQIVAAQATAVSISPVSNVPGKAFDRIMQIWLENTDYAMAEGNSDMQFLASQGITLTNFFALTHPSQPNYAASVSGDTFGMDHDDFTRVPSNISTIIDLLDSKGISWAEYQESLPYAGFQGLNFSNQRTGANDYVRKHNPLVMFDSVVGNATRLGMMKNFTGLEEDLKAEKMPQWMFVSPNMTNNGHDTSVTHAATWARSFLTPLLSNTYFTNSTLIILTFDEDEHYTSPNKVLTLLLGGAIPSSLHGTTDSTFYNHYSAISSVSLNWGLPSLGRWDCNANVFAIVANKTSHTNAVVDTTKLYFNTSYPGPQSNKAYVPVYAAPDTNGKCAAGSVLESVVKTWGKSDGGMVYENVYPLDAGSGNNVGGSATTSGVVGSATPSKTGSSSASTSSASSSSIKSMAWWSGFNSAFLLGTVVVCITFVMSVAL